MEQNKPREVRPLSSSLGSVIRCLTDRHPTQALRVTVALVLQRGSGWACEATADDARQIWRNLEPGELRDASAPVLAGLEEGEELHRGTDRAWNKSLADAWRATFRAPRPCNGPWRALGLAVSLEEGARTSALSSSLRIPYGCISGRRSRIDLRDWRGVFRELGDVVVPGVVDHGEDSPSHHDKRKGGTAPERDRRANHSGTEQPDIGEPYDVRFHWQHPPPQPHGFVVREIVPRRNGRGGMFVVDIGPPTARAISARKSEPST